MEKRALLAIALSILVMAVWYVLFAPPPPAQLVPPAAPAETGQATAPDNAGAPAGGAQAPDAAATPEAPAVEIPAPAEAIRATDREEFRVTTATQDVRFTNVGGRISWWRLTRYTIDGGIAVDLIPDSARSLDLLPLQIEVAGRPELTKELAEALYVHEEEALPGARRVSFTYASGSGLRAHKSLDLSEDGYLNRVAFEVRLDGKPLEATLIWASGLAQRSDDKTSTYGHVEGQGVIHDGREVVRLPAAKVTEARVYGPATGTPLRWAGLESTYFAALIVPSGPEDAAGAAPAGLTVALTPRVSPSVAGATPETLLTAGLPSPTGSGSFAVFVGPKDYHDLKALGHDLEKVIDFSRFSIIYAVTLWLFLALTWINSYVGNYGWSIIILTFVVRLVFFPITYRSMITMRQTSKKMAKVQPKVKAIQERYRKMKKSMDTQKKMNEEVMALYQKEGVNPMANLGGCLPLLLQMPIFIAFYNLLAVTIEMRQAPFIGWITDLSRHDPYYITPILMGASWLLQQAMTSSSIPDPTQRRMMMIMPVMFTFFMMNMPSGLVIYWLTTNLLGMVQQYVTNKKADHLDALARGSSGAVSRSVGAEDGQKA